MRYEDTTQAGGIAQGHGPNAENDLDTLTASSRTPATGNVITGADTKSGAAGADTGDQAHVVSISSHAGEDSTFVGGKLTAEGDYGKLTIAADGSYRYVPKANVPENSLDRFVYTLADGNGAQDSAVLTIEFGKTLSAVKANAQQVVPGPDGVVVLPAGVELSDVHIVGRNLVIDLPDGSQMVIVDGAVFVPQLSLDGVDVPATNLAALLIGSEPKPAVGGEPPSSGGNFEVPVPPLDPGVPLGDLIPPTQYNYAPPEVHEVYGILDRQPTVTITPDNGVAVQDAVTSVDEAGLPTREGEPAGSNSAANSETTTGTINIDSPDSPSTVTIDGVAITTVGQVIHGQYGDLTITSVSGTTIGYSYTLFDNTSGNSTSDVFNVVVTDVDGDTANASLTVNIVDDVPTARPDVDTVVAGTYGPETGNVMTGAGTAGGNGGAGADTVGADDATLTLVSGAGGSDSSYDEDGNLVVHGQYGILSIDADGNYSYVRNPGTPGGVSDTFNYTLTDGDGDTSTSTLTINIADLPPEIKVEDKTPEAAGSDNLVYESGLPTRGLEPAGSDSSAPSESTSGTFTVSGGDGPLSIYVNGATTAIAAGDNITTATGVLHIDSIVNGVVTYTYTLSDNTSGDNTSDVFNLVVKDVDGDTKSTTLTIAIVDDVPTARNDVDTIAGGGSEATGNVISGDSTNGGLNGPGADTVGADNATVVAVSSDNVEGNADTTPSGANGELVVQGEYGQLTIYADGHYDYVRNDGTPGNVSDVFTYTLKDGDGDTSTATLTINIEDATPTLETPAVVQLDDDAVLGAGGNPGVPANGDDPDGVNASGTLAGSGGDGTLTYGFSGTNTLPSGFTIAAQSNGDLWVMQGATHVMTVTLDTATGAYSVTQVQAIDHPSLDGLAGDNTENNLTFDIGVKVTDVDGDPATATLTINVDDDTPTVTPRIDSEAALSVDESGPTAAAAIDTGSVVKGDDPNVSGSGAIAHDSSGVALVDLNASFGADGPAASNPIHYELNVTNATSGLTLTDGSAINLVELANGVVVGVVQGSGAFAGQAAFAIAIDPTTGVVTIEQYLSLDHPLNPNPNDSLSLAAGSLAIVGTATDHDGDTVSTGNVDVSGQFTFLDDGPSVNPTLNAQATVSVDESLPSTTPTIVLVDYVAANDPDLAGGLALGHDTSGSAIVNAGAAFGADGPAAGGGVSYALSILNTSSGLTLTDGTAINLVMDHGVIVGVVASGTFAGQAALAISIDPTTGVVTVEQYLSLQNPIAPSNYDEIVQLANNTVGVTVTATDGDGDSITSDAVDVSHQFSFHDDGPQANNDSATQSAENAPVTVNVFANDVGGADGALASSVALVTGSLQVTAGQTAGTLTNNGDGTFTYTPSAGQTGTVTFNYTITDGDGDKSQATVTINLTADSTPQIGTPANLTVDEDGFGNANVDNSPLQSNPQEVDSNESLTNSGSVIVSYGSDVPTGTLTNSIALVDTAALDGQLQRLNGSPVTFALNGSGQLVGSADGHTVIIISVTGAVAGPGADQVTYTYQAQLLEPLEHPASGGENTDLLSGVTFQVTDSDGSTATGNFNVTVYDDVPSLAFTNTAEGPVLLTTHDALTDAPDNQEAVSTTANFSGVFALNATPGADGGTPSAIAYDLNVTDPASGLTSHGLPITLVELANGTVVGYTGSAVPTLESAASVVFSVKVDASGDVTLTQYQQIDHPVEASPVPGTDAPFDDQLAVLANGHITLTGSASLTDGDGDTANASRTIDLGGNLQFADDGPALANVSGGASVTLDETSGAIAGTAGGMNPISATSLSAVITATQAFGADGPAASGSVVYGLSLSGGGSTVASGLQTAVGDFAITLNLVDATHITGTYNGANVAFSITMNADGTVTVTQNVPLEHLVDGSTTTAYDDSLDLVADGSLTNLVNATITIKDYDGDTATASTGIGDQIIFKDDGPSINVSQTGEGSILLTTHDALTIGTATDTASSTANFSSVFSLTSAAGADGGTTTPLGFALHATAATSGLTSQGATIYLYEIGGKVVGSTSTTLGGVLAGNTIFDVSVTTGGAVTLTQYQQVDHALEASPVPGTGAPFDDQFAILANGKITLTASASITDNDGDSASASQTVDLGGNLRFADDGPVAANDTATQTTENQAFTINPFGNDQFGADGVDIHNAASISFTQPPAGQGTVSYNATTGLFTFTPASGQEGSTSFTYTITDFDGDTSTATVTVNLQPDSIPVVTNATASVDDDGLANGIPGGTGDIDANTGEALPVNPSEAVFHGQFVATAGNDTIVNYSLAGMNGLTGTVGTETVSYSWNNATSTLTATVTSGTRTGTDLYKVVVNQATGAYDVTLLDNVLHASGGNETSAPVVNLTFTATDSDGDSRPGTLAVTFNDDTPTLGTVQSQQANNDPNQTPAVGTLHFSPGADGAGSAMTITANVTGIKSGGYNLVTEQSGNVLTAYQDVNGDGIHQAGESTQVFTITVDPNAGTSGQYTFNLITALDPTVTDVPIGGSSSFGAGPTASQILTNTGGSQQLSVVTGYLTGGGFSEATWLSSGVASGLTLSSVNGSTAGWGIANNNFEGTNEFFNWDFGSGALDTQGGLFTPPGSVTLPNITYATFDFIGYTGADDIKYVVHYTDGTFASGTIPAANLGSGPDWTISAPGGKFIADVEMFSSGTAPGKVDLVSVGVTNSTIDKTINATVQLTDGDGDPTATGAFSIHVSTGLTPFAPAAPVVLDMNGDGVHFLGHEAGVLYDYGNDGAKESTAWVSPGDALLVRDADGNHNVSGASEFVFGHDGLTDLQALAAQYGNTLDANDADYAKFGVWQDANSNGVVDAGEYKTLAEAGITSISLVSDGVAYSAAGGDVTVAGSGTFTLADGSTGVLADATFATGSGSTDEQKLATASTSTVALAAAIAAAGLASLPAAASEVAKAATADAHDLLTSGPAANVQQGSLHADNDEDGRQSVSGEHREAVSDNAQVSNAHVSSEPAHVAASLDHVAADSAQAVATALLAATESGHADGNVSSLVAPMVAMPSAEMVAAANLDGNVQKAGQVDKVLAESLADHGGAKIDQLLQAATGHEGGDAVAKLAASAASPDAGHVQAWDMAMAMGFHPAADMMFKADASMLHQDAIQPTVHG